MTKIELRTYEAGYCIHPECATRRGASLAPARFPALTFLLSHPTMGRMLFDTGYSQHFIDATKQLPERLYRAVTPVKLGPERSLRSQLSREGIEHDDIACVVLSHLHGDHIGGLLDFPQTSVVCSREAWDDMQARSRLSSLRIGLLPKLLPSDFLARVSWIEDKPIRVLPSELGEFGTGRDLLEDGSVIAIALPGHAAGHFGLFFSDSAGRRVFLVADAAWSSQAIREGVPPPSVVTGWLGDTEAYRDTLQRLHRIAVRSPWIQIVPSHCDEFIHA